MNAEQNTRLKDLIGTDINKYTITRYISSGSFGDVFEARNKKTNELVALKIPVQNKERDGQKSLLDEAKIYKTISSPENGIANMKVTTCKDRKIIVMDLLGPSLEFIVASRKKFGLKTVTYFAIQMIDIMKYIHSCGYIHRDVKPDNFVIGSEDKKKLYCIDFGLAKRYLRKNDEHIPFSQDRRFCGTARYASIAAHNNTEQGRKDDLESVAYILIYLFKGKLPWQGIKHKDKKERYRLIGEKKENLSEETLCEGMPREFCVFLKYVRSMDFDEKPHYSALKNMFSKLYQSRNYKTDKLDYE
jgi:serine/threonine protein kinase